MNTKDDRKLPPFLKKGEAQTISSYSTSSLDTEDHIFYGVVPQVEKVQALKVLYHNEMQFYYHYNRMGSPIIFDGENEISIPFGKKEITITGDNLELIFDLIGHQRLSWIREGRPNEQMEIAENEPFIRVIQFKDL